MSAGRDYMVFGDYAGRVEMINVECKRCGRKGRYRLDKLIAERGRDGNMQLWLHSLSEGCPQRDAHHLAERCRVITPGLWKVLDGMEGVASLVPPPTPSKGRR